MTTFRLATINVHSFHNRSEHTNNIYDLAAILNPLNLDLLAVQEVFNDENWINFCQLLSLPSNAFNSSDEDYFGNGIASRYPIQSYSNQLANNFCPGHRRSLLQCNLDGNHPFIIDRTFAVTHLDHLKENTRLAQIQEFNPYKQNIDILMGDMNALTRDDYSDNYYRNIVRGKREKSRWEKPFFDFAKLITREWKYQDAFKLINPELKDEQVATCRFGTRIDYIYIHPRVNDQWTLTECSIINAQPATDHNVVLAVFEQKSK
jgi:endonuclease/exonuclease/phosphatase family metal-dependent hydrolase